MVGDDSGEGGEERGEEHTHIADVDGDVEKVQHMIQSCRCDHQPCRQKKEKKNKET